MKKSILFVAALLCGTMAFAEIINIWTAAEVAGDETDDLGPSMGWANATEYPTFMFDDYIRATAVGATNGVYWESAKFRGDWRVYQSRAVEVVDQDTIYGHFYFTAEKGAKITKLGLTYSTNYVKGGGLISRVPGCNQTDSIASDSILVFPDGTDSVSLYVGVSASAVRGQVRIQRFYIEYTIFKFKVSTSVNNNTYGSVSVRGEYIPDETATLIANPNYGYHFTQWSDGNTDNPRTFVLTQDTAFMAIFDKDTISITTAENYPERGIAHGDTTILYLDTISISAVANYGYHFTQWNDGNKDNPRQIVVTGNQTYTAQFDKDVFSVTCSFTNGNVIYQKSGQYLDTITLTAIANWGYHFTGWSDGNTDNSRSFVLTQDTIFEALFAKTYSDKCGDNLYWQYTPGLLTIYGSGGMYDFTKSTIPWSLFQDSIQAIVLCNGVTHIGNNAFNGMSKLTQLDFPSTVQTIGQYACANCTKLGTITLGAQLTNIGANAFYECRDLFDIYCYAKNPPRAEQSSFANYNGYLYISCDVFDLYDRDAVLGSFKHVKCIGAEETTTEDVEVKPADNCVVITWPTDEETFTYDLYVYDEHGNEVCILSFDASGTMTGISYPSPSRGGATNVAAEQILGGYRFTITGLDPGTNYTYAVVYKDEQGTTTHAESGNFTTTGEITPGGVPTALPNASFPSGEDRGEAAKVLKNGQLLILRDNKIYNAQGTEVK